MKRYRRHGVFNFDTTRKLHGALRVQLQALYDLEIPSPDNKTPAGNSLVDLFGTMEQNERNNIFQLENKLSRTLA